MKLLAAKDESTDIIDRQYVDGKLIPAGGSADQVLAKSSGTDYDVGWVTPSGGGGQTAHTVLYNNSSGAAGDITLSQSAANFDYLQIFYFENTDGSIKPSASVIVRDPNGKQIQLGISLASSANAFAMGKTVDISGTTITAAGSWYGYAKANGSESFVHTDCISITRVEGWNDEIVNVTFPLTANQVPDVNDLNGYNSHVYDATISRTKNTVLAAPDGTNGAASFRQIKPNDVGGPIIDIRQATTGSASRAANSSGTVALTLTAPSGYVIAHVLSVASNGGWVPAYVDMSVNDLFGATSKSVNVQWANGFSVAQTCSFSVRFMCVLDGWAKKN